VSGADPLMTTSVNTGTRKTLAVSLDDLYPAAAWELPVNPALPAPRLSSPPAERRNLSGYRDHYLPFILDELPVSGAIERIAIIDKAFPHPWSCVGIPGFSRGGKRILVPEARSAGVLCASGVTVRWDASGSRCTGVSRSVALRRRILRSRSGTRRRTPCRCG
jgi:hypothetical protein